jgi:hypothetical protein
MSDKISLLTYLFFFFFIFYSTIGYGWLFSKFLNKNSSINLGYLGVYGLFFLAFYSYASHHFIPHTQFHNLAFITLGFFLYVFFFINSYKNYSKSHLLLFAIVFISSLLIKNHDDFPYYHFAYTYFLTQQSSLFGIGIFNHGFRTPSSIFYIGSLFYLPVIKYYTFHFVAVFVLIIANYIFIKKIINFYKDRSFNFIFYFCLLCFSFINIVFYRIGEHGSDRSAQIFALILVVELLTIANIKNYYIKNYSKIFILIGLIITFKAFYILYSIFIIYLLFFLLKKISARELFLKNWNLYWCCALILVSLFATFQNSGCFLYPIKYSCVGNFNWAINKQEILLMSNWYELWSKGGAAPNFRVENPDLYIQGFNWVPNWTKIYFFTKVSDTMLGILSICLIFLATFFSTIKNKKLFRVYKAILLLTILLLVEWFTKHPALRYGGFCLVALLFFIPTSLQLELYRQDKIFKKIIFIFILTTVIFLGRNLNRINKEAEKYQYNPLTNPTYTVDNSFFRIPHEIEKLIFNFHNCQNLKKSCVPDLNPKVGLLYNKYIFYK